MLSVPKTTAHNNLQKDHETCVEGL